MRTIAIGAILILFGMAIPLSVSGSVTDAGVTLYTPYTKISVPPGQSIDYSVEVINNGSDLRRVSLSLNGLPKGWAYELKSGGWTIGEISVLPKEKKNLTLRVDVPLKVDKGIYRFDLIAPGLTVLPLTVVVSEQGTFKTELSIKQPNMVGSTSASFTFNAEIKNRTAEKQFYSLRAAAPAGWNVAFKTSGRQVTSVPVEPNHTESVTLEVDPPDAIQAGTYRIPLSAVTNTSSANEQVEVVVTGTYGLELTTPTGLLSTSVTAGDERRVELQVKNTGSTTLSNIKLSHAAPVNWEVFFDPKQVDKLESGKTAMVYAAIKADRKAIAGDYVTNLEAKTSEASSKATMRVSVKTSVVYGWLGLTIIGGVVGVVYWQFRKFGRR